MENRKKAILTGDEDVRLRVGQALNGVDSVEVIGEFAALEQRHLEFLRILEPQVIVFDATVTWIDPIWAVAELRRTLPSALIVAVVAAKSVGLQRIHALRNAGADAVGNTVEGLRSAVRNEEVGTGEANTDRRAA